MLTLTKFLKKPNTNSRDEFQLLHREATIVAKKGMMSVMALAQIIMDKLPDSIKLLSFLALQESESWQQFTAKASRLVGWVPRTDVKSNQSTVSSIK